MNNTNILHAINQFPVAKFPGIKSIVVSHKTKNGKPIDQTAIVFGVHEKIPADQLSKDQLLPEVVQVGDEQIITDVIEDQIDWQFEALCPAVSDQNRDTHRMYTRPIKGGLSVGIDDNQHKRRVGTMGLLVRDLTDGQLVGLTCSHVLAPDIYTTADRQINTTYNYKDIQVVQPARAEGYNDVLYDSHVVGHVKRIYPLITDNRDNPNAIDAAIFTIDSDIDVDMSSGSLVGLVDESTGEQIDIIPFATTDEINNIDTNTPLFKSSRTTGAIGSTHHIDDVQDQNACALRMFDRLAGAVRRVSGRWFSPTFAYYDPVMNYDPSQGGDSGSVICAWIENQWKVIGIHFAGGRSNKIEYGLACRIDQVAELLLIGDLTSTADTYPRGETQPVYHIEENHRGAIYLTIDGKRYWQVGRISEPVATN